MKTLARLPGFPEGKLRVTPVPNLFFSDLLPAIDHLGELKVTLYAFWALANKEGTFRYLRRDDCGDAIAAGRPESRPARRR